MRIAVTSKAKGLDSEVDPRFGRAPFIVIVDSESMETETVDNAGNVHALKGAGIQAAATMSQKKVDVVLTGHCGPNAFKALTAAKIGVANGARGSVRDAVTSYLDGTLPLSQEADVEGHW
jgi:predicted Fe-Mo cluster-binding NifX family protein